MSKSKLPALKGYALLLEQIKGRIQLAQTQAVLSANAELVRLYWDIGRMIEERQQKEGWGASVIPRLALALRKELVNVRGFSERNMSRMIAFFRSYPDPAAILPQAVAKLPADSILPQPVAKLPTDSILPQAVAKLPLPNDSILWAIPWGHHALLLEKVELAHRRWYMEQTLVNGWSRNILLHSIQSQAHRRQGKTLTNFKQFLPAPQSDLAQQLLKDPYIFDFLTLQEPFHERELEMNLLHQLERFLIELGQGFAFVGRQFPLKVDGTEFSIDLLFFHLKLRSYVVIDLKKGEFKPEYAGKMNFYLSVVDDQLRHTLDNPSIGLILCQDRNQVIAEYALRGVNKPIGISGYELTRTLPSSMQSALPTVEEIEAELAASAAKSATKKRRSAPNKQLKSGRKK